MEGTELGHMTMYILRELKKWKPRVKNMGKQHILLVFSGLKTQECLIIIWESQAN